MEYKKTDQGHLIRLFIGEEVHQTLVDFCIKEKIKSGFLFGIGAVSKATLSFYHLAKKEYAAKEFNQPLEVASLTGNISLVDDKPFIHIHTTVSDENFNSFSGHLKEAIVGPTLEVVLFDMDVSVSRKLDEEIGLKLLDFSD